MMRWARAGPMPGRVCRSVALAVSSRTQADWVDSAPPLGSGGDCPSAATRMCSPSTTGRARLIASRSASSRAPPAAVMASMTREEAGRVRTPGVATAPETWTTTSPALSVPGVAGPAGVAPGPPAPASAAFSAWSSADCSAAWSASRARSVARACLHTPIPASSTRTIRTAATVVDPGSRRMADGSGGSSSSLMALSYTALVKAAILR